MLLTSFLLRVLPPFFAKLLIYSLYNIPQLALKNKCFFQSFHSSRQDMVMFVFDSFFFTNQDKIYCLYCRFNAVTAVMGVPILWFVFIGLFLCLYLALSKHGNVELFGERVAKFCPCFSYIGCVWPCSSSGVFIPFLNGSLLWMGLGLRALFSGSR